jgi:myosin heavy subunit
VGTSILLALSVYGVVTVFGNEHFLVDYVWPVVSFLGTGAGVLVSVSVALLLLGASRTQYSKSKPGYVVSSSEADRERIRLQAALREVEREREHLGSQLQESKRKLERLMTKMHQRDEELERLGSKLRDGKRERERLKSQLQEIKRERERLSSELREAERVLQWLRSSPQEDEQERQWLKSENERLRAERDALEEKMKTQDKRITLKQALNAAYRDGLYLSGKTPTHRRRGNSDRRRNDEGAARWAIRTGELIKEALGEDEARRFLGVDAQSSEDPNTTEEQKRLNGRLNRLSELIQRVDSLHPLELRPNFVENGSAYSTKREQP